MMGSTWIVIRKELTEVFRDRRTLIAIGLAGYAQRKHGQVRHVRKTPGQPAKGR